METNGIKMPTIKNITLNLLQGRNDYVHFGVSCPNLAPLKQDTISFKGNVLKKSDFKGSDLAVIERYKPNIQQFKSKEDLQTFAEDKIRTIILKPTLSKDIATLKQVQVDDLKDFGGRQEETKVQRKAMLKEWFEYVIKENDAYSNAQRLIILSAITKDLKENNDTIPPVLNKGILADTVTELEEKLKANPKENFDFNKMYQNNLRTLIFDVTGTGETMTGWIVIPSKINDPENFEKNVDKLKTLSHNSWCTKSFNAEPYLSKGDFHIYLENGQPKLGVRFVGDEVGEIQGEKNNGRIPPMYFDTLKLHQKECNFKLNSFATEQFENAEAAKIELQKLKQEIGSAIELKTIDDVIKILDYAGIKAVKKDEGIVISHFVQPDVNYSRFDFASLGIDENKLLKDVVEIKGRADFTACLATDLPKLKSIGGSAIFENSNIKQADALESIGGNLNIRKSSLKSMKNLTFIGGNADFYGCANFTSLENLKTIGGNADFCYSEIIDLGQLEEIGGDAHFYGNSKITNLCKLKSIGGLANFSKSNIRSLDNLEEIGGDACFQNSEVKDLGNLKKIGGSAVFIFSKLFNLGNLHEIGEDAYFGCSSVKNLGNLKLIRGKVHLQGSQLRRKCFKNILVGRIGK